MWKYNLCKDNGVKLIRIKELQKSKKINIINSADIILSYNNLWKYDILEKCALKDLFNYFSRNYDIDTSIVDINIERDMYDIYTYIENNLKEISFKKEYPDLAKEWHPTKNGKLTPDMFLSGAKIKVWWKCSKCGCEWKSTIYGRTRWRKVANKLYCKKCSRNELHKLLFNKKVDMLDVNTNMVIRTFSSITEANVELNIKSSSSISRVYVLENIKLVLDINGDGI